MSDSTFVVGARPSASDHISVSDNRFYLIMSIASTLLVFAAFSRTFYLKSYFGMPPVDAVVIVHGIIFSTWMLLFVSQTALIASQRSDVHRWLGVPLFVLATGMILLGVIVAFRAEKLGHGTPSPDTTFLFSLVDIATFAIFVIAGFLWRHWREAHQRLMLLAVTAGLLAATPPRLPLVGGHPPLMAMVGFSFLFAGPIYDLITRRRLHPAYIWGCLFALLTAPPIRLALASTQAWHNTAHWLVGR